MGKSVGSMVGIGGLEVDGPDVLLHERQSKVCGVQRAGRLAGCWRDPRGKIGKSKRALRGTTARSQMDDLGRERKREVGVGARTRVRIRWALFTRVLAYDEEKEAIKESIQPLEHKEAS
ncbi:conserved hypothetical protein [Histoplasma capsulatum var. duboisii H88]|uniref:Uncharacterized protein n=1 Tax=Ajellomyces capsulatus (strain H88) TaxID=544711 RepID=F0UL93_AJEC8|nr:conserved hypothetical protein [Histoplasma capsulatum var. duboisii H88]